MTSDAVACANGVVAFAQAEPRSSTTDLPLARPGRYALACPDTCYHALVFGQGPAACLFAIQMARRGKTVLLVPSLRVSSPKPWGETLAPRGEFLLARLGLVNECLAGQHATQTVLSCWHNALPERIDLSFDPHGRMWHIDRPAFDRALQAHAIVSGVDILDRRSFTPTSFSRGIASWEVRLASLAAERVLKVDTLVDATGKSAWLARLMGARRILRDHLVAVSCVFDQASVIEPLLIEPVGQGWWYSLGLPRGRMLAACVTDPRLVKLSTTTRKAFWTDMLVAAPYTWKRIGACEHSLRVVSAESARLDSMSGTGWLAIGDAAMSFDPLSSHGLCSAIEQAIEAADLLSAHGHTAIASEFEARRSALFEKYRARRLNFYQDVRRFSGYAFWQNRTLQPKWVEPAYAG